MEYCPSCGTKLSDAPNFCPDCGQTLERSSLNNSEVEVQNQPDLSQRKTQSDRITVNTGLGSERIYNLDNITYFEKLELKYTLLGKAIFIIVAIVWIWFTNAIESIWFTNGIESIAMMSIGLVVIAATWYNSRKDQLVIGTTADRDSISTDDPNAVESDFVRKTSKQISMEGRIKSEIRQLDYTYHFLPENMISVEKFESINRKRLILLTSFVIVMLLLSVQLVTDDASEGTALTAGAIGFISTIIISIMYLYTWGKISQNEGELVNEKQGLYSRGLSVLFWILFFSLIFWVVSFAMSDWSDPQVVEILSSVSILSGIILLLVILDAPHPGVLISLPNDEQVHFSMSKADAETLIEEFID